MLHKLINICLYENRRGEKNIQLNKNVHWYLYYIDWYLYNHILINMFFFKLFE